MSEKKTARWVQVHSGKPLKVGTTGVAAEEDSIVHLLPAHSSLEEVHKIAREFTNKLNDSEGSRLILTGGCPKRGGHFVVRGEVGTKSAAHREAMRKDPRVRRVIPAPKSRNHWYNGQISLNDGSGAVTSQFPNEDSSDTCSNSMTSNRQTAFRLDALRTETTVLQGGPILQVIWEPNCSRTTFQSEIVATELGSSRGGGAAGWMDAGGATEDSADGEGWHATSCAICMGGISTGVNPHSALVILNTLPMTVSSVLTVRTLLEKLPTNLPKIISLSSESVWSGLTEATDIQSVAEECNEMDQEIEDMQNSMNVLLLASAGNDNLNLCTTGRTKTVDRPGYANNTMSWPSTTASNDYSVTPYMLVGATMPVTGTNNRTKAFYSNFGECVGLATHGSRVCLPAELGPSPTLSAIDGTSFSTPLASGMAGLIWASDISQTPAQVRTALRTASSPYSTPGWSILGAAGFLQLPERFALPVAGATTSTSNVAMSSTSTVTANTSLETELASFMSSSDATADGSSASRAYVLSTSPSDARALVSGGSSSSSETARVGLYVGLGLGTVIFTSLVTVLMVKHISKKKSKPRRKM